MTMSSWKWIVSNSCCCGRGETGPLPRRLPNGILGLRRELQSVALRYFALLSVDLQHRRALLPGFRIDHQEIRTRLELTETDLSSRLAAAALA